MPSRQYSYQYETSPRKIRPDYSKPKRNNQKQNFKKDTNVKKQKNYNNIKQENKVKNKKKEENKANNRLISKTKLSLFVKCVLFFGITFLIILRNSQISENFSQIQKLKTSITEIQKENDQLEINIQNSINLNNIEKDAKELLGMQKRSNKQTVHISLSKKDYVEPRTEEVIIEEKQSFVEMLIEKIKNLF